VSVSVRARERESERERLRALPRGGGRCTGLREGARSKTGDVWGEGEEIALEDLNLVVALATSSRARAREREG